ncbi:MAG: DUF3160 domain-containing protein [Deltaproteobacteria bacterium]|nr:DUF3160 domain-containing protein [Deltaproteobacteria bacterium]
MFQQISKPTLIIVMAVMWVSCSWSDSDKNTPENNSDTADSDSASDSTSDTIPDSIEPQIIPEDEAAILKKIEAEAAASENMTFDELLTRYPAQSNTSLDFSPLEALNLSLIQLSDFALDETALALLEANGFVISNTSDRSSFFREYAKIYKADLPVYISADAILDAMHRSFDDILKSLEERTLYSSLDTLLGDLRADLNSSSTLPNEVKADLDTYLTIAHSLLLDKLQPVHFAPKDDVEALYNDARSASGIGSATLFGENRELDFSQFKPRGHYLESEELETYFRAMMWLGRIDFRMVETLSNGSQVLRRRQLAAVLGLHFLTQAHLSEWHVINRVVELFVGESDNLTPLQTGDMFTALNVSRFADLDSFSDDEIKEKILSNGFGAQRICSHIMNNGMASGTLPLNASFLIFGQRFVVDSHVFSNLVYDRVQKGKLMRMMPNPLDVGFAVLNNNQSGPLLKDEMTLANYAPDLHMMRTVVSAYDDDFWDANLYNLWL